MTKKKAAGGKGKGEARAARPGKATPEERASLRAQAKSEKRAALDLLHKQMRAQHRAFVDKVEPVVPVEIDWSTRPSEYTEELANALCERIATSSRSLGRICCEEGMPSVKTVFGWFTSHPNFELKYARARDSQADHLAEECLDIADTQHIGEKVTSSLKDGVKITREDMLGHRDLRIETRKWLASKLRPKKYGTQNVKIGGDPDNPLLVADPDSMSDEALAKIAAERAVKKAVGE